MSHNILYFEGGILSLFANTHPHGFDVHVTLVLCIKALKSTKKNFTPQNFSTVNVLVDYTEDRAYIILTVGIMYLCS